MGTCDDMGTCVMDMETCDGYGHISYLEIIEQDQEPIFSLSSTVESRD